MWKLRSQESKWACGIINGFVSGFPAPLAFTGTEVYTERAAVLIAREEFAEKSEMAGAGAGDWLVLLKQRLHRLTVEPGGTLRPHLLQPAILAGGLVVVPWVSDGLESWSASPAKPCNYEHV